MSAALLMSNFQANLRALFTHEISLRALVEKLNDRVLHAANGEKFITLFVAKYNFKTKELEYINAGHNRPILYKMKDKSIEFLDKGCVGIGMLDEIPLVKKGLMYIEEPSKILCYTDGLVELMDGLGVSTETSEIEECLQNDGSIEENIQSIIGRQKIMENTTAIFDDISILGLEII